MTEEDPGLQVEPDWEALLGAILASGGGRIGLLGPSDSGKSTLGRWLGRALAEHGPTGRLDGDPGQSRIGPPATIALGREPDAEEHPEAACFVGDVSPARNFLGMAAGVSLLTRKAENQGFRHLVLDSPGFLDFSSGHALHLHMVRIMDLDHLVVLDGHAMAPVVEPLRRSPRPRIHQVAPSAAVVTRSRAARREYRDRRLREALTGTRSRRVPAGIPVHGRIPDREEDWPGRVAGLLDGQGFLLRLCVVEERTPGTLRVRSHGIDFRAVSSIEIGTVRLEA